MVSWQPVVISVHGDLGEVTADVATPLAVTVAELLQNAVEHTFDPETSVARTAPPGWRVRAVRRATRRGPRRPDAVQRGHRPLRGGARRRAGAAARSTSSGRRASASRSSATSWSVSWKEPSPWRACRSPPGAGLGWPSPCRCERPGDRGAGSSSLQKARWERRAASHALRSLRRSSSEVPPETPDSWFVARAKSRQGSSASQERQTRLAASIWSTAGPVVPTGKKRSGSVLRQAATRRRCPRPNDGPVPA